MICKTVWVELTFWADSSEIQKEENWTVGLALVAESDDRWHHESNFGRRNWTGENWQLVFRCGLFMRRQNLKLSQWSKSENDFGQKNVREKTAANSNVRKEAAEGGKSIVRISISRVAGIVVAAAGHGHGRGTATGRRVSDWNVTFVPEVRMLQSLWSRDPRAGIEGQHPFQQILALRTNVRNQRIQRCSRQVGVRVPGQRTRFGPFVDRRRSDHSENPKTMDTFYSISRQISDDLAEIWDRNGQSGKWAAAEGNEKSAGGGDGQETAEQETAGRNTTLNVLEDFGELIGLGLATEERLPPE